MAEEEKEEEAEEKEEGGREDIEEECLMGPLTPPYRRLRHQQRVIVGAVPVLAPARARGRGAWYGQQRAELLRVGTAKVQRLGTRRR